MVRWPVLLPVVWQGGAEQGDNGKPLRAVHYHLGLICAHCMDYFTTSANAMHQHTKVCKPTTGSDDDDYREEDDYGDDDNGDKDDKFMFKED